MGLYPSVGGRQGQWWAGYGIHLLGILLSPTLAQAPFSRGGNLDVLLTV